MWTWRNIPLELRRARYHCHPFSSQVHSDQSSERADPFDLPDLLPDRVDMVFTRGGKEMSQKCPIPTATLAGLVGPAQIEDAT
jgi:hypothetical protein